MNATGQLRVARVDRGFLALFSENDSPALPNVRGIWEAIKEGTQTRWPSFIVGQRVSLTSAIAELCKMPSHVELVMWLRGTVVLHQRNTPVLLGAGKTIADLERATSVGDLSSVALPIEQLVQATADLGFPAVRIVIDPFTAALPNIGNMSDERAAECLLDRVATADAGRKTIGVCCYGQVQPERTAVLSGAIRGLLADGNLVQPISAIEDAVNARTGEHGVSCLASTLGHRSEEFFLSVEHADA